MSEKMIYLLKTLTIQQKKYVLDNYMNKEKNVFIGYVLWFFFGFHYFYVGKPFINLIYIITGGGFMIWAFIDLFRMKKIILRKNEKILEELVLEAKRVYPYNN